MVFLLAAFGSFVLIEPAPVDALTIGIAVLLFSTGLRLPREFLTPLAFLLIFLLGNVISIYLSQEPMAAFIYFAVTAYLVLGLVLFVGLMYWNYQRLLQYFWSGYVLAAAVATSAAIIGFFGWLPDSDLFTLYGRGSGTFKDPNVYGPFLVPVILYLLNSLDEIKGGKRLFNVALMLFFIFGLFLSFSRGAFLNLVIAVFVLLYLKLRIHGSMSRFQHYFVLGSLVTVSLLASFTIVVSMTDRLQSMVEVRAQVVQDYDVEEGGRFNTQLRALESAAERPLGVGPGESDQLLGLEPHNVYLLVLIENGVLGFIGWVGFFVLTLFCATRYLRHALVVPREFLPVYAAVVGILLESFIIDSIHWRFLFVFSGVLWGILLAARQQESVWLLELQKERETAAVPSGCPAR